MAQLELFGPERPAGVEPAPSRPEHAALARHLPASVRLGTSSWSFPGWQGIVYARSHSRAELARGGLAAYARHPLLRCAGIDRTFYAPLSDTALAAYAAVVPEDFRFVVKAWEELTLARFPRHARYGARAGQPNPRFLDAACATRDVIEPLARGLGARLGAIVFQFPPQDPTDAPDFAARIGDFLAALPRGPLYAVEVRNRSWLDADYARALLTGGGAACLTVHPRMPSIREQARIAAGPGPLVVRWMLGGRLDYDAARRRYAPFDRLAAADVATREEIADLVEAATRRGAPAYVSINNKAEGSAPLSAFALADAIVRRRGSGESRRRW